MFHEFDDSLEHSHKAQDLPFWETCYRQFFGELFGSMHNHRNDDQAQRLGIDRIVVLKTSKVLRIDEKVRWKDYGDILLEYWSDSHRQTPGWVCKELACDFIAYAIAPAGICYLMPTLQLQIAWNTKKEDWIKLYKKIEAVNIDPYTQRSWLTVSVAIPTDVLLGHLLCACRAKFSPINL